MASIGVRAQSTEPLDSATLWSRITVIEDRYLADFPKTFREVENLFLQALTSTCESCKGRAYMMYGKFFWANGQYPEGLVNFRKAAKISSQLTDYDTWIKSIDLIGNTYYYQAYYDSAEYYFKQAYSIAEETDDREAMIMILHDLSLMYHRKGDFKKTVEYIFKGEKLRDELPEAKHYIEAMGAMGPLMIDSIYYKGEIEVELRNLKHHMANGDTMLMYHTYQNLGKAHRQLNDYKSAARYFIKACEVMSTINLLPEWDLVAIDYQSAGMKDSCFYYHYKAKEDFHRYTRPNASYTMELLGDAHSHFGQLDSAVFYYDSALAMSYRMNNRITFTGIHRHLVRAHTRLRNYEEAERHLETGLRLAKEISLIHEKNLLDEGRVLYEQKGEYKKALYYSERFKDYLDSINRQETAINLTRMQADFENAKKESELVELKQINLLNEQKIKTRNLQITLAVVSVLMVGAGGLFFYYESDKKKKSNQLLAKQNQIIEEQYKFVSQQKEEKEILLQEIHHRVKNNLQIISSLINLKARNQSAETSNILKDVNSRIYSLGLIHEMLYKADNLGSVDLKEYVGEQCQLTVQSLEAENIELYMDLQSVHANVDSALAIGLISNELITNAIKYAFDKTQAAKKIYVSLNRQLEHWVFKIADNGEGEPVSKGQLNKSFGLRFVDQLVRSKLNGEMNILFQDGFQIEMKLSQPTWR
ncbi:MAG: histidine kinase dimerization/phosphoacceptor domain -containing protein [Cyclobacteriaceae bacterium]